MTFPNIYLHTQEAAEYLIGRIEKTFKIDYGPRPEAKIGRFKDVVINLDKTYEKRPTSFNAKNTRQIAHTLIKGNNGFYGPLTNQVLLFPIPRIMNLLRFKTVAANTDGTSPIKTLTHELFHKYQHNILGEEYMARTFSDSDIGNYYANTLEEGVSEIYTEEFFNRNKGEFTQEHRDVTENAESLQNIFYLARSSALSREILLKQSTKHSIDESSEQAEQIAILRRHMPILGYNHVKWMKENGMKIDEIILAPLPTYQEFFDRINKKLSGGTR